jgi:hypothetical protein
VKDVERTGIDFLVKNFKDYTALRDKLMSQTPYLRGQMEVGLGHFSHALLCSQIRFN